MDIDLNDVDLPTTKEKRKRVSTEISDREKFNAFPEEDSDYNSKVLSAFSGYQFSGSQSSLPKKRDSTEIFDRKKFIAVLEEDSDHNSELWSAFTGSRSSLPKKGDLVFYFPQGHLEYEDPLLRGQPPKEEVRTYGLQPQIICRVEHVQLMIKGADDDEICAKITLHPEPEIKEADDEICANITLQPEPEVNSEEIEDCIWDEDGRLDPISTPNLFSKIFEWPDYIIESLTIPPKAAIEFFCWDKGSMDLQNGVTAKDFHGNEWKFPLIRDIKNGNWLLGWSEFARARNLVRGDRVVFLREKDTKLRFGIRRKDFCFPLGIANDDPLSEAAGAVLKKSIFSVMNVARSYHEDFVIPYHKYMKSITRPGFIGAKVHKQYRYPLTRELGVVTGMADLDPKNWPNSKWKCLLVTWVKSSYEVRVSPWEIVFDDSPSPSFGSSCITEVILPRRQGSAVMYRKEMPQTSTSICKESKLKKRQKGVPWTEEEHRLFLIGLQKLGKGDWRGIARNYVISRTPTQVASHARKYFIRKSNATRRKRRSSLSDMATDTLLSDEAIRSEKQKHVQEPGSIHCEADTTNHPFDIQKQTPAPQTSSQLTLYPDLCSLTSFSESKSTTNYEELKISNCSVDDLWRHLKENHSYEYLEFDSCSFPSSTRIPIPVTIKKLKITNCVDTEQVFTVLMDPNLSVESLEIDSCSSFSSMSTGGIPATLGQLKIVNCMNLNSLSESFETEKSPINERVHYSMADILELRKLEIQNCQKLESLPKGLHKLRNLDLLSINDCCSLEYFPEGGLPITCLTSLSISGCENLKCLPNKLHKVTSLQNLSISGCPSLMLFPEGGLPPNLVSLRIIDCENLISLSQWELHRHKHLRKYSFSCGCSDSEE